MKRIVRPLFFALALLMAAAMLFGCGDKKATGETAWVDVNSGNIKKPSNNNDAPGETVAVKDEDGRIMLASDEDRLVFKKDNVYRVFVFNGTYVTAAYKVYAFSDGVDADNYIKNNVTDIMSDGSVIDIERQSELVVLRLNMYNSKNEKYLSSERAAVEEEFGDYEKQ